MREYLTNKRIMVKPLLPCRCKQIISKILTNCCCGPSKPLVFSRLTEPKNNIPKRRRVQRQSVIINKEPLSMTLNAVNKGERSLDRRHSSDIEACHYTHLRLGMLAPRNYKRFAQGSNKEEEAYIDHSAIAMP